MPNMSDMQQFLAEAGPNPSTEAFKKFAGKFSGVDGETHAKALREQIEVNRKLLDAQKELDDVKAHYEAKLKAANARIAELEALVRKL